MILVDHFLFKTRASSSRKTKQDFIDYCVDLQRIESGFLHFSDKVGFSFAELLELCLIENSVISEWFLKSEVIVIAHESYEYDPDYAHIVPYVINRFNLVSSVIAISSPKENLLDNAKHILAACLSKSDHGLIVVFEQAILPLCVNATIALPTYASVSVCKYIA
ncbi:MAG: hypothetical protein Q8L78_03745 [Coxiellaceae bacterium]|nr:hypothetical protein [Coxiellaceae bacterium]